MVLRSGGGVCDHPGVLGDNFDVVATLDAIVMVCLGCGGVVISSPIVHVRCSLGRVVITRFY